MKPYRIILMVLTIFFTGTSNADVTSPIELYDVDKFVKVAHKYHKYKSGQKNAISKIEYQSYIEFISMQYLTIISVVDNSKNNEMVLPLLSLCIKANSSDIVGPEKIADGVTNLLTGFTRSGVAVGNSFPLIAMSASLEHPCQ